MKEDIYKKMKEIRKRQNDERIKELLIAKQRESGLKDKEKQLVRDNLLAIKQYIKDHKVYVYTKHYFAVEIKGLKKFIDDQLKGLRR